MLKEEITKIVEDYRKAAANAIAAGFDGVEIHGANGYLIDQFMRTTSNIRTDEYGGNQQNRLRFLREVVNAVVDEIGAEHVGIRLAPFITARGMNCPEIQSTILKAAEFLESRNIAYIHLAEADWDDAPQIDLAFRQQLRSLFKRAILVTGKYNHQRAQDILSDGYADAVGFGRPFVANPDLPHRLANNLPLGTPDMNTLFGGSVKGYTDYPVYTG